MLKTYFTQLWLLVAQALVSSWDNSCGDLLPGLNWTCSECCALDRRQSRRPSLTLATANNFTLISDFIIVMWHYVELMWCKGNKWRKMLFSSFYEKHFKENIFCALGGLNQTQKSILRMLTFWGSTEWVVGLFFHLFICFLGFFLIVII